MGDDDFVKIEIATGTVKIRMEDVRVRARELCDYFKAAGVDKAMALCAMTLVVEQIKDEGFWFPPAPEEVN